MTDKEIKELKAGADAKTQKEQKERLLYLLIYRAKQRSLKRKLLIFETAGYLGLYGSYIIVPTILASFAGRWLDKHYPIEGFSWVLNLVLIFVVLSFINATLWAFNEGVKKAEQERRKEQEAVDKALKEEAEQMPEDNITENLNKQELEKKPQINHQTTEAQNTGKKKKPESDKGELL